MAIQGNAFQGDAFQIAKEGTGTLGWFVVASSANLARSGSTGTSQVVEPIERFLKEAWKTQGSTFLARESRVRTFPDSLDPRRVDLIGGVQVLEDRVYLTPNDYSRTLSPGQRFTDPPPFDPRLGHAWLPMTEITAQGISGYQNIAQTIFIDSFVPNAWKASVTVTLPSGTVSRLATQAQRFVETFNPVAWQAAVTVTLPPVTVAGLATQTERFVETFYPQAWSAAAATQIAPATIAGFATQTERFVETLYPQAWLASVATKIAPATLAGFAIQTQRFVETFYPQAWVGSIMVSLPPAGVGGEITRARAENTAYYPFVIQAWRSATSVSLPAQTVVGFATQTERFVETFYPQAWGAAVRINLPPVTVAGLALQTQHFIETFYPQAWSASAVVNLLPLTIAGPAIQTQHYIETFFPQAWRATAMVSLTSVTVEGETLRPEQGIENFFALPPWDAKTSTVLPSVTVSGKVLLGYREIPAIENTPSSLYPWIASLNVMAPSVTVSTVFRRHSAPEVFNPQSWASLTATNVVPKTAANLNLIENDFQATRPMPGIWHRRSDTTSAMPATSLSAFNISLMVPADTLPPSLAGFYVVDNWRKALSSWPTSKSNVLLEGTYYQASVPVQAPGTDDWIVRWRRNLRR